MAVMLRGIRGHALSVARYRRALLAVLLLSVPVAPCTAKPWYFSDGFEQKLSPPWGTGQYAEGKPTWWNSGDCQSTAMIDYHVVHSGHFALHISNHSQRAASVYGTTQRPLSLEAGQRFRIEVWAKARLLNSNGGVSIALDRDWSVRPIQLPGGTYDWRTLTAEFTWRGGDGQLRILCEDRGDVWLDDISIISLDPAATSGPEPLPLLSKDEPIGAAVTRFRDFALADYRQALQALATRQARQRFADFDRHVWRDLRPETGWSWFFNTSVMAAGGTDEHFALVGYYNPWCDVLLVTEWDRTTRTTLSDAELIAGDWLRTRNTFPRRPSPGWLRGPAFRPAALAMTMAESVDAFQTVFAGATRDNWRGRLAGLDQRRAIEEINYPCVRALLTGALRRVEEFYAPRRDEEEQLTALREQTFAAMQMATSDRLEDLLAEANQTPALVANTLRQTPVRELKDLVVVGTVIGEDASLVFLAPAHGADYCVSMLLDGRDKRIVRRIDIVAYDAACKRWKTDRPSATATKTSR